MEKSNNENRWTSITMILVVFFILAAAFGGCQQTEQTKRERIKLQLEQVKQGYSIETNRSSTTHIGTETK
jgi:Tfp pilus assembly protein PilO